MARAGGAAARLPSGIARAGGVGPRRRARRAALARLTPATFHVQETTLRITFTESEPHLAQAAAERVTTLVERACRERRSATLCLTGGSTPRRLYARLGDPGGPAAGRIDWSRVHLFWGDERHVPPDDPDSNFGMAERELVSRVPVPPEQVHRMRGEMQDASAAALAYDASLRAGFAAAGRAGTRFDVMLLGVGADAHIASVFPGSPLLATASEQVLSEGPSIELPAARARSPLAAAVREPYEGKWRITLTPDALLDAGAIVVLVSGTGKAEAVEAAFNREDDVARWPAQLLRRATGDVEWIVDRAAASSLGDIRT